MIQLTNTRCLRSRLADYLFPVGRTAVAGCLVVTMLTCPSAFTVAASLSVELEGGNRVTQVGAVARWDSDGNPRQAVDPKAKFASPSVEAWAKPQTGGKWLFPDIPSGRYDLVIFLGERVRIEGFDFPPVLEFDPFLRVNQKPAQEQVKAIVDQISKAPHYENKVHPLWFAGDDRSVRVFVQLLRDEATSYDADYGAPVATIRHEVWQFTNRYGTWTKEKRTRVFDRVLAPRAEVRQWTWVWDPELGGVEVGKSDVTVRYRLSSRLDPKATVGLHPY